MRAVLVGNDEPGWLDENSRLLLRASRDVASKCGLLRTNVLYRSRHIQWFPWIGSRGLQTLRAFARSAKIVHEADHISITYELTDRDAFADHLNMICTSSVTPTALAGLIPVKAVQKFDDFLSSGVLDIVNGHDRLDLGEAKQAAQLALSSAGNNSR